MTNSDKSKTKKVLSIHYIAQGYIYKFILTSPTPFGFFLSLPSNHIPPF